MAPLIAPHVHLNGTPKDRLLDGYIDAADAVRTAIEALAKTGPNARDYYMAPAGANRGIEEAQRQHYARLQKLHDVLKELEGIAEAVADQ